MSTLVGSLLTRFAWIMAGHASAEDHKLPLRPGPAAPELPPDPH
jgi:hypothetical protein